MSENLTPHVGFDGEKKGRTMLAKASLLGKWNEQIKAARLAIKPKSTQNQVAAAAGITTRNYQDIEAGRTFPTEKTLLAICRFLNCVVIFPEADLENFIKD